MIQHAGNALNQMTFEEHDGANNAKRVSIALGGSGLVSLPTLYAVVNTSSAGAVTVQPVGLTTLAPSPNFIGLVTTIPGSNVTLNPSAAFIGIVTLANQPALPASAAYIGLVTVGGIGTITLADPKGFIGLTTVVPGSNVTLNASAAFIGITTIANQPALVASAAYIGLVTVGGIGTLTLSDPKGFIGLVTSGGGFVAMSDGADTVMKLSVASVADGKYLMAGIRSNSTVLLGNQPPLTAGVAGIGFATIAIGTNVNTNIGLVTVAGGAAWADPKTYIGLVTVGGIGTLTLADPKGFIGLTTLGGGFSAIVDGADTVMKLSVASVADGKYMMTGIRSNSTVLLGNQPALTAGAAYIGLVTVGGIGTITLADPKGYIGLTTTTLGIGDRFIGLATVVTSGNITVLTRNAGTNKTLLTLPVTLSTGSIATIAIPTNAQAIYITHLMLNSNATVRLNVKSGVTYLTGNASLGINLFPGGGLVQDGSADSPVYLGNASGGLFIEKADSGGVISQIGGMVTYFQE